ncbi:MAG: aminomethyl-transferring glycine dehydrogenase [Candidatus Nanopelagicaceae bacterium]
MVEKVNEGSRLFQSRHIGPRGNDLDAMLQFLNLAHLDELMERTIPRSIRTSLDDTKLPEPLSEAEVLRKLRLIASNNKVVTSMIGLGYYDTELPTVIKRNVLENPAWYTAYTPYQPEISQGRLETLFLFQTVVSDLTGLPISNASMLDEPTAAAEAMTLARRLWKGDENAPFLVDENTHPQTLAVIETRAEPLGIEVRTIDITQPIPEGYAVLISYPTSTGELHSPAGAISQIHQRGGLAIAATDLLALTLFKSPGEWGFDIAVGSAQRFGVPMGFGGPHAGFLSVREGMERSIPGRLVGESVDAHGNRAYRLALQTREQHIRREKATSNICTAQALLANISALYAMWHGPDGLRAIALRIKHQAASFAQSAKNAGFEISDDERFDTVTIRKVEAERLRRQVLGEGINICVRDDETISISFDEKSTGEHLDALGRGFGFEVQRYEGKVSEEFKRTSRYLTDPIFSAKQSETAMMRYLRSLADKDLALDRTMIPLGSCTMKLNAATEMESITWPEFASLHPFAPEDQSRGTRQIISELTSWLIEVTGYDAISLQPNAGSQGEFAGLLAIRAYHRARKEGHRDICLIPSSAHGTNAASAIMAGMKVVVVGCDDSGNVDMKDLADKISEHRTSLAALMVTYPSTHGVYEDTITEICEMVHDAGGQVYVDGANLNALVGVAKPGKFGADVSHLNLHKTFCIPHGGGGPGVGPIGVKAHLAPYLPNHPLDKSAGPESGVGPISGAPFGSAGILTIPWSYIQLMGGAGLTEATQMAILSANYLAKKLDPLFPVLYKGREGFIAHECIIDIRPLNKSVGVSVDDIAKRLMDGGFHAPTVSFPVAGTLMIEPTESEDLGELDRFVAACAAIRAEITAVELGEVQMENSPLRHAPHTAHFLISDWKEVYPATQGAYLTQEQVLPALRSGAPGKYWPPVGRIDGAHGDRNLVCACPRPEELALHA